MIDWITGEPISKRALRKEIRLTKKCLRNPRNGVLKPALVRRLVRLARELKGR